jgi:hypothetical protein
MTATHFILSALCIGFAKTGIEWLIIGFLFHKYQALTPQTWRAENKTSYMYSTLLAFGFGILFTIFYQKIGSLYTGAGNSWNDIKLGLICFACFGLILEMNNAIYINYDKGFVLANLTASLLNYIVAAIIAGLFFIN